MTVRKRVIQDGFLFSGSVSHKLNDKTENLKTNISRSVWELGTFFEALEI